MFRVDPNPQFTHEVKISVPVNGGFAPQSFKATFRVLDAGEAAAFDLTDADGSTDFLRRVLVSLDDIVDANDAQVPYNDQLRDQLLGLPYVRLALARTYFDALRHDA